MFLFVYADLLSLFRPGELAEISAGNMGPVDVSQGSLLIAAVAVTIPALMIVVSAAAPFPLVRWLSLGVGVLYISSVSATSSVSPGRTTCCSASLRSGSPVWSWPTPTVGGARARRRRRAGRPDVSPPGM